ARIGIRCGIADPFLHISTRAGATEKACFLPTSIFRRLPPPPDVRRGGGLGDAFAIVFTRARGRHKGRIVFRPVWVLKPTTPARPAVRRRAIRRVFLTRLHARAREEPTSSKRLVSARGREARRGVSL